MLVLSVYLIPHGIYHISHHRRGRLHSETIEDLMLYGYTAKADVYEEQNTLLRNSLLPTKSNCQKEEKREDTLDQLEPDLISSDEEEGPQEDIEEPDDDDDDDDDLPEMESTQTRRTSERSRRRPRNDDLYY